MSDMEINVELDLIDNLSKQMKAAANQIDRFGKEASKAFKSKDMAAFNKQVDKTRDNLTKIWEGARKQVLSREVKAALGPAARLGKETKALAETMRLTAKEQAKITKAAKDAGDALLRNGKVTKEQHAAIRRGLMLEHRLNSGIDRVYKSQVAAVNRKIAGMARVVDHAKVEERLARKNLAHEKARSSLQRALAQQRWREFRREEAERKRAADRAARDERRAEQQRGQFQRRMATQRYAEFRREEGLKAAQERRVASLQMAFARQRQAEFRKEQAAQAAQERRTASIQRTFARQRQREFQAEQRAAEIARRNRAANLAGIRDRVGGSTMSLSGPGSLYGLAAGSAVGIGLRRAVTASSDVERSTSLAGVYAGRPGVDGRPIADSIRGQALRSAGEFGVNPADLISATGEGLKAGVPAEIASEYMRAAAYGMASFDMKSDDFATKYGKLVAQMQATRGGVTGEGIINSIDAINYMADTSAASEAEILTFMRRGYLNMAGAKFADNEILGIGTALTAALGSPEIAARFTGFTTGTLFPRLINPQTKADKSKQALFSKELGYDPKQFGADYAANPFQTMMGVFDKLRQLEEKDPNKAASVRQRLFGAEWQDDAARFMMLTGEVTKNVDELNARLHKGSASSVLAAKLDNLSGSWRQLKAEISATSAVAFNPTLGPLKTFNERARGNLANIRGAGVDRVVAAGLDGLIKGATGYDNSTAFMDSFMGKPYGEPGKATTGGKGVRQSGDILRGQRDSYAAVGTFAERVRSAMTTVGQFVNGFVSMIERIKDFGSSLGIEDLPGKLAAVAGGLLALNLALGVLIGTLGIASKLTFGIVGGALGWMGKGLLGLGGAGAAAAAVPGAAAAGGGATLASRLLFGARLATGIGAGTAAAYAMVAPILNGPNPTRTYPKTADQAIGGPKGPGGPMTRQDRVQDYLSRLPGGIKSNREDIAPPMGVSATVTKLKEANASLQQLNTTVSPNVNTASIDAALQKVMALGAALRSLGGSANVNVGTTGGGAAPSSAASVGEKVGAAVPPRGGSSGGSVSNNVTVAVNVNGSKANDPKAIGDAAQRAIMANLRRSYSDVEVA